MLVERFFGLSPALASFDERQFDRGDPAVRVALEKVLKVFIAGYNIALTVRDNAAVSTQLENTFDPHHVGFAFEGAGMRYAMFDLLTPWTASRLRAFTDGAGRKHDYIATVGAGFAVARVPWGRRLLHRYLLGLDPAVAWCVIDGYGFHQGIFDWKRYVLEGRQAPAEFPGYARQLFDCGMGRSLWWTQGASPPRIRRAIDRFSEERRGDMWCGIGVAASYAGGVEDEILDDLLDQSGTWSFDFLSGFPLSARMRQKGQNPSPWTDRACVRLLNLTAAAAADLVVDHVGAITADLERRGRTPMEDGYGLLREGLRNAVTRRARLDVVPVQPIIVRKAYGTQRQ